MFTRQKYKLRTANIDVQNLVLKCFEVDVSSDFKHPKFFCKRELDRFLAAQKQRVFTNMEGKWFCAVVIHANFAKFALEWHERKKVGANLPKESQKLRNVHSLF